MKTSASKRRNIAGASNSLWKALVGKHFIYLYPEKPMATARTRYCCSLCFAGLSTEMDMGEDAVNNGVPNENVPPTRAPTAITTAVLLSVDAGHPD